VLAAGHGVVDGRPIFAGNAELRACCGLGVGYGFKPHIHVARAVFRSRVAKEIHVFFIDVDHQPHHVVAIFYLSDLAHLRTFFVDTT
jgi:hypothetical protein